MLFFSVSVFTSCQTIQSNNNNMPKQNPKYTNALAQETSPYLLQHAHNPVDWMPWGEKALKKATQEQKPLLISIGYSACHWCHVMEHESFEDTAIAKIMNEYFVCIKVDREERPDIDQVYMDAVQMMTGQGGWPLNCFALPDGRPFYGGTYFPPTKWVEILNQLHDIYVNQPEKVEEYAQRLAAGMEQTNLIPETKDTTFNIEKLNAMVEKWKSSFDHIEGGPNRAPKFPVPNNYEFLLQYSLLEKQQGIQYHVYLTLQKMATRGLYDLVGGGFTRYSTDVYWKVPHFEKMLYDNAQLLSLYAQAYRESKNPLYKRTIEQTITFVQRELSNGNNFYFSALDADSEGEEGKFYIWKKEELSKVLKGDIELFAQLYHIDDFGLWEHDNYIIMERENTPAENADELKEKFMNLLFEERAKRVRPGLDDKTLTSWNGLLLAGYCEAYKSLGNEEYLNKAKQLAKFLLNQQRMDDGGLYHNFKNGKSNIIGYLEDYCFTIKGLIQLYQISFNEDYLFEARNLANYTIDHFFDDASGFFFFTSDKGEKLISRKFETTDSVIPSSNSCMAKSLFLLGHYFENKSYLKISKDMVLAIAEDFDKYPPGYSNWATLYLWHTKPFLEIAIAGDNAIEMSKSLYQNTFVNNALFMGCSQPNTKLPLLQNKYSPNTTNIFVCENKTCKLPVSSVDEAINQISEYH